MSKTFNSMLKNSLILGAFATITIGLILLTQQLTAQRIINSEKEAQQRVLAKILPNSSHDNRLLDNTINVSDPKLLGYKTPRKAYIAIKNGRPSAIVLHAVAPDGYAGDIQLLVAININGQLAGVRAIKHKETPGLGDKIDLSKTHWILNFNGKSIKNLTKDEWAVKKDQGVFDQFAGATITPRAVVKAVHKALLYFDKNKKTLFKTHTKFTKK